MAGDRELALRVVAEDRPAGSTLAKDVMSPGIRSCFDDEDVHAAADHMSEWQVRRLAVLDRNKRLVGIVSLGDLTKDDDLTDSAVALQATGPAG